MRDLGEPKTRKRPTKPPLGGRLTIHRKIVGHTSTWLTCSSTETTIRRQFDISNKPLRFHRAWQGPTSCSAKLTFGSSDMIRHGWSLKPRCDSRLKITTCH